MQQFSFDERAYDLADISSLQRDTLLTILEDIPAENRIFLLDEDLRDPLSFIASDIFKGKSVMPLAISPQATLKSAANLIFLFDHTKILTAISSAKAALKIQSSVAIHFIASPFCDQYIEKLVVDMGLSDQMHTLEALPCHTVLLDTDVMTLNLPFCLNHMLYQKSMITSQRTAKALYQLASMTGMFQNIHARGTEGVRCLHAFLAELKSSPPKSYAGSPSQQPFEHVFLIDRSIDLLSLTLEPWTYEALLAETFSFHNSSLQIDKSSAPMYLNTALDEVYKDLKATHITQLKTKIDKILEELKKIEQEKEQAIAGRDNLSIQQIRLIHERSIKAEKNEKLTEFHVGLANKILKSMSYEIGQAFVLKRDLFKECALSKKFSDYLLGRVLGGAPLVELLQLYILVMTVAQPKAKDVQTLRSHISARYGVMADFLLDTLDMSAWVPPLTSKSWFKDVRSSYSLLYEAEHTVRSQAGSSVPLRDISDVFNSRAPLSVRIFEKEIKAILSSAAGDKPHRAVKQGVAGLEASINTSSGDKTGDLYVPTARMWAVKKPPESWNGSVGEDVQLHPNLVAEPHGSSILVVFLGGVTFAELAALTILEEQLIVQYGPQINILTIGTSVASGRDILTTLIESVDDIDS